ncbi:tyrosyl-DNA phosphodiesterase [Purpureocillium lavendulum]|uniref:Tyrosyl-DNA phosphodiesterase n=1 Tax=Purpureocillium lavendulum TaxID=1247861 RepID=A0AB34G2I5_9HYPO|nr:tyrosyl-DNA phosphodiesterase [Purpureocillium lavendulum]
MDRPSKRQRIVEPEEPTTPLSLSRPISPPPKLRRREPQVLPSPWQLTRIRDLPEKFNRDAVSLKDLLGDPLISECWEFNFLHDLHFLMGAFDPDTRHLVKVHVVHGFWKREDPNQLRLTEEASEYSNIQLHVAPMPEIFGTHHSKMMILFRHDDTAQVVIHTANMIAKDWTNMTNGVWKSPPLPKLSGQVNASRGSHSAAFGTGDKFKSDLLSYLSSYDRRRPTCKDLVESLAQYDFSQIRAALIASVPGTHNTRDQSETAWGWAAVKRCLRMVPCREGDSQIVIQISSIATLGAKDDWLQTTLFGPLSSTNSKQVSKRPKFSVIYPTADEIRRSLDGYASGGSIHTKIQSQQQAKQLQYLRPMFHHWANDSENGRSVAADAETADGGRNRAAPHIKTYIRYNSSGSLDWALLTSANLSKQAWGETAKPTGEMRVASWEIGVLTWPELYGEDSVMLGTFNADTPALDAEEHRGRSHVVGLRIPYSLPLQRYGTDEVPWVPTMTHTIPDRLGRTWDG